MKSLAIVFALCIGYLNSVYSFKYEDCGGKDAVIRFKRLEVTPEKPNIYEDIFINAKFEVKEPVPGDTIVDLKVGKHVGTGDIGFGLPKLESPPVTVPCLKNIGSCKYKLSDIFGNNDFCKYLKEIGGKCDIPVAAGTYKSKKDKGIKLDKIKHQSLGIEKGHYKVEARFLSPKKQELGCLKADFTLK